MTITVTTNKGEREIELPTHMGEVKTSAFQRLYSEDHNNDPAQILSILCDLPNKFLYDTTNSKLTEVILQALNFIKDDSWKQTPIPKEIIVKRKSKAIYIAIPKQRNLSIGQMIHLRQKSEKVKYMEEMIAFACAVFLQPIYSNDSFDYDKVLDLEAKILELPIIETYPLGFFLLSQQTKDGKSISNLCNLIYIRFSQRWNTGRKLARLQRSTALNLSNI